MDDFIASNIPDAGMSKTAVDADKQMATGLYPVAKIFSDPKFNCRGHISPLSVVDLARDIAKHGLQCPVSLRPRCDSDPAGFDYALISGHRRHKAYVVNGAQMIPGILRPGLSEFTMRTLNAIENLKRKDLDMLQEARTVEHYKNAGYSREDVANEIGMSPGWVQVRFMLLDLDPEIQEAAAAGFFSTTNVRDLYSVKDPKKRFDAAKAIKSAKLRGDKKVASEVVKKKRTHDTKRRRTPPEIGELLRECQRTIGNGFYTRVLAWVLGNVSDWEIYTDLQAECAAQRIPYELPDFINTQFAVSEELLEKTTEEIEKERQKMGQELRLI